MNSLSKALNNVALLSAVLLCFFVGCSRDTLAGLRDHAPNNPILKQKGLTMHNMAVLSPEVNGSHILLHLNIKNSSSNEALLLEPWQLFKDKFFNNSVSQLTCEEQEVEFIGPMIKRTPTPNPQLVRVGPGQSVNGTVDISTLYSFPAGMHDYHVRYLAAVDTTGGSIPMLVIQSPVVSFTLER